MQEHPLVSIIIPTYNRAHLIGETLDSVLAQTYTHWECIVVDDGSMDATDELLATYVEKDSRFQYHNRPKDRPKGANACRNYGFELSTGEYVNWFDSDDLMKPNFLEKKLNAIKDLDSDYIISKTAGFKHPDVNNIKEFYTVYYTFEKYQITHFNYVSQLVNWLTYDFFCKKELVAEIRFNENLKSAQEYNFFAKVSLKSTNYGLLDEVLTHRRLHSNTITKAKNKSILEHNSQYFRSFFETFKDLYGYSERDSITFLYQKQQGLILTRKLKSKDYLNFIWLTKKVFGLKTVSYLVSYLIINGFTHRGYLLRSKYSKSVERFFANYTVKYYLK